MSRVFADTYYFLALLNKKDEAHEKALEYAALMDKLVTSEWVFIELANGLASSSQRHMFFETRRELLEDANVEIVPLDTELHEEGIRLYAGRPDKQWSLTDCVSFLAMKRLGISEALTSDHHFEQAGFVALMN